MQSKILTVATLLVVLATVSSVYGGYLSPYALSAHPIPLAHVVHSPVIVKAPIATSYQSFTKVDRPALVAYTPTIVKTPIIPTYTTVVKPLHYPAPLPLAYHGYPGYHGYQGLGYHGYLH